MNTLPSEHAVVTSEAWLAARLQLLEDEKALMRRSDELARQRRALPWTRVEKDYRFQTPQGERRLVELFEGRRQLLVQHFMLAPGAAQGCPSCSYMADHHDGMTVHLAHRDVTLLVVSRAPIAEIERFKARMGWRFGWASSNGSDFNYDFCVSFAPEDAVRGEVYYNYGLRESHGQESPGISVFVRNDAGEVFHTYSTYGRGVEVMMGTYPLLDLMPLGRAERDVPHKMEWVRHHDRYEPAPAPPAAAACCSTRR